LRRIIGLSRSTPNCPRRRGLRPVERPVLKSLETGFDYQEIASMPRRTPARVQRVAGVANFALASRADGNDPV